MTKLSDRVDELQNESNDESEETGSHGAVNIEFHGEKNNLGQTELVRTIGMKNCLGLSDLLQSQRNGPSNQQPLNDNREINTKITEGSFEFATP